MIISPKIGHFLADQFAAPGLLPLVAAQDVQLVVLRVDHRQRVSPQPVHAQPQQRLPAEALLAETGALHPQLHLGDGLVPAHFEEVDLPQIADVGADELSGGVSTSSDSSGFQKERLMGRSSISSFLRAKLRCCARTRSPRKLSGGRRTCRGGGGRSRCAAG